MVLSIRSILYITKKCITVNRIKGINTIFYASIQNSSPIVFENSLVYWTLQHFKSDEKYLTHPVNNSLERSDSEIKQILKNTEHLAVIDTNELLNHMMMISKNVITDTEMLENVDRELCRRLEDGVNVLQITDTLLYFTHNRITMIKSYRMCIESIRDILRYKEITLQHFIQCAFYTSVLKDDLLTREIMNIILKKIHKQIIILYAITPLQLAIFCNSIYKTSTKIKSKKVLKAIVEAIDKSAKTLFINPLLAVSILKPLHQAKYHDYSFLEKLSHDILHNKSIGVEMYEFTSIVYLLKLFTNGLYNNEILIDYLSDLAIIQLNSLYKSKKYIRAKDLSTLLKSFCEMGSDFLKQKVINSILPIVYDAAKNRHFERNELKSLMEILLWICILDSSMLNKNFMNNIVNKHLIQVGKQGIKGIARMNLFLTILSTEQLLVSTKVNQLLELIESTEDYDFTLLSTRRPNLDKIYQAVLCLSATNKTVIKSVNIECQVPNLYIPGIAIETNRCKKIAIESIDDKVCLHDSLTPNGYMKLKLRLLKRLGYEIVTIPQDVTDEGSECLFTTIDDSITKMEGGERIHF